MSGQPTTTELEKLKDTGLELDDDTQDIRNRKVVDAHDQDLGHVSALFIDRRERKVRMVEIRTGGFLGIGDRHVLLPVDAITRVGKSDVHVNQTRERIIASPAYDPKLTETPTREYWEPYYGYYGLLPYWNAEYMYPHFPTSADEISPNQHSGYTGD
jgi:sporulation protein YlmC with PRC-barrel domain